MKTSTKTTIQGFQVVEHECIWMKAGVINFRICDMAYDCNHCAFDKGMRRLMGMKHQGPPEKVASNWAKDLQKRYRGADRPCRHRLTGRVDAPKICILNYECYHCAYDQMLDDLDEQQLVHQPQTVLAGGYHLAQDYYYHMGHSWVRMEHGGRSRVGLDDFAVSLFGPIQRLTLPPLGAEVDQDHVGWTFTCNTMEAAVLSPISGVVLAVNHGAQEHPEIGNEDPYHSGWLFLVEPTHPKKDLKKLYFGDQSRRWMEMEAQQLLSMMGPEYERLAATGTRAMRNVIGTVPNLDGYALAKQFLRTEALGNAA